MQTTPMLPCQIDEVVTIRITTEQLKLLSNACTHYHCDLEGTGRCIPEISEEMRALSACFDDIVHAPDPTATYGIAL